jgi:enterochelin esterase family protein
LSDPIAIDRRIAEFQHAVKAGDDQALKTFWEEAASGGAPLVEQDGDHSLVTYIWRGDGSTRRVQLHAPVDRSGEDVHELVQLPGSDLWHVSFRLRNDYYGTYKFEVFDSENAGEGVEHPDPFNTAVYIEPADPDRSDFNVDDVDSVVALADAPERPWENADVPAGATRQFAIQRKILGNQRRVWIYRSPGHDFADGDTPVLIVLDGRYFVHAIRAPQVLDYLLDAGQIPGLAAVFVDNPGKTWEEGDAIRSKELACHAPFSNFLADELLPWLQTEHGLKASPSRTIVAGGSLGGLAAAHAVLARANAFKNALSMSGSFWWGPDRNWEWLARAVTGFESTPRRFFIEVGAHESAPRPNGYTGQVLASRHLSDVLLAAGHEVTYVEEMHGHDSIAWQKGLGDGLRALI